MQFENLDKIPGELFTEIKPEPMPDNLADILPTGAPSSLIDDFGAYAKPMDNPGGTMPQTLNTGSLLTAKTVVDLSDMVIPSLLVLAIKKAMQKTVSKKAFKLNADEKHTIEPVLQNYLNSVNFSVDSPGNALLITLLMIYGSKAVEAINDVPAGNFKAPGNGIGETTAAGHIKRDGRGRPKGTAKNK